MISRSDGGEKKESLYVENQDDGSERRKVSVLKIRGDGEKKEHFCVAMRSFKRQPE